jgi:hypothetical protein
MRPAHKKTRAWLKDGLFLSLLFLGTSLSSTAIAQAPGTFTPTGKMTTDRSRHTATLLNNGKVLIVGGGVGVAGLPEVLASAELYDPDRGTFAATGSMTTARITIPLPVPLPTRATWSHAVQVTASYPAQQWSSLNDWGRRDLFLTKPFLAPNSLFLPR